MAFCPSCGAAAQQNARFCVKCGHALQTESRARIDQEAQSHSQLKSSDRLTLKSLYEAGCLFWPDRCGGMTREFTPTTQGEIGEILLDVGDSPLRVNGPTGFALLTNMGIVNDDETIIVFCYERRPEPGYNRRHTGEFRFKKKGGHWVA
jgi:hypothetical protein